MAGRGRVRGGGVVWLMVSLLASAGCDQLGAMGGPGSQGVYWQAGVPVVEGVRLEHRREVVLSGAVTGDTVELSSVAGTVSARAGDRPDASVTVTVFEASPNDASVTWTGRMLSVTTASGEPALVHDITAELPQSAVRVKTVSGPIELEGFAGVPSLFAETVSGGVSLREARDVGEVTLSSISGDDTGGIRVEGAQGVAALRIETVSADAALRGLAGVERVSFESVSGGLRCVGCELGAVSLQSVSGGAEFDASTAERVEGQSVSGSLVERGSSLGAVSFRSTSGGYQREP